MPRPPLSPHHLRGGLAITKAKAARRETMAAPQAILNTIFATSVGLLVYLLLNPDGDVLIGLLASLIGSLSVTVVALILQSTLKRK